MERVRPKRGGTRRTRDFLSSDCLLVHISVLFGPWSEHVNNWWEKQQTCANIHYMFYEDLVEVRMN